MTTTLDNMTPRGLAALPPAATKTDTYRDGKTPGLELEVSTRGRMTWVFRYAVRRDGKRVFPELRLGYFPALSLAQARELAHTARQALDKGHDPSAALGLASPPPSARPAPPAPVGVAVSAEMRKLLGLGDAAVLPNSFAALAITYLVHHAQPNKESWKEDATRLRRYLLPHWRDLDVTTISRAMVHARLDAIAERGARDADPVAGPDGRLVLAAPVMANRILSLTSMVFNIGIDRSWLEHHPTVRIRTRDENPRDRWLKKPEVLAMWDACERDPDPICAAALLLQLFTAQRGSMILLAEWPEFELDEAAWTIPKCRVKNRKGDHRVPLGPLSVQLLRELQDAGYHGQYAFPHRGVGLRSPAFFTALYDALARARGPLRSGALAHALAGVPLSPTRAALTLRISCELSRRAKEANPFVIRTPDGWALTNRTLRPVLGDGPLTLRTTSWREFTERVTKRLGFWPHDLRRTMTTHLGRLKVPREFRGKILSHTKKAKRGGDITERVYDQWEYDDEKVAAMQVWHEELARWRQLPPAGTDRVLRFPA